ncbi:MAG: PVC-type heme-binding CxxCH protein [Verrucomicrobiota bacterium]
MRDRKGRELLSVTLTFRARTSVRLTVGPPSEGGLKSALRSWCVRAIVCWLACSPCLIAAEIKPADDTPPPLSPEESLKRFQLPAGFRIELVASEPHLADPTGIAFDARGRIFVCELHGYNLEGHYEVLELNKTGQLDKSVRRILASKEALERAEKETYGTVKLLEDTDGDGRMDRAAVWADRLPACYGVVAARDGVIVLCAPDIVYLADRNGDGQAEVRETLFTGFGVGELWTRISHPQWGVDNWIYAACGDGSAGTIRGPHLATPVKLGRTGFRFKADGSRFEPVSGGTSGFGLALSDWDDRFLVSNQQHALYVAPLPYRYLARNPHYAAPNTVVNISSYGHPAQVFPTAPPDPWRLRRSQEPDWVKFYGAAETTMGLVTAACAPLVYRADQFPVEYRDNHFSCESAYNLIHRCVLQTAGASFKAVRPLENTEFLTSTEQWFRPVNLAVGPEGALYVVDMYREIIEDYSAIPRYLQQQYGLIKGHDRGRIWRVLYEQAALPSQAGLAKAPSPPDKAAPPVSSEAHPPLTPGLSLVEREKLKPSTRVLAEDASVTTLVRTLSSGNAWLRLTAQRLLVERKDKSAVTPLVALVRNGPTPQARLHGLYTLDGLDALEPVLVEAALGDAHPGVRLHALRLADRWLDQRPALLETVLRMIDDADAKVRLQAAFTLGGTRDVRRLAALATLASRYGDDRWMQAAIVSSVPESASHLLNEILRQTGGAGVGGHLFKPLASVVGARQQNEEIGDLLETITSFQAAEVAAVQTNCLAGLLEGLRRGQPSVLTAANGLAAWRQLLASSAPEVRTLALQLTSLLQLAQAPEILAVFERAAQEALDPRRSVQERQSAIAWLAGAPFSTLGPAARKLLEARQPLDVQLAAVAALAASDDPAVGPALLAGYSAYSPRVQTAALDAIFRRQQRLAALLDAMESGSFPPQSLDSLRRSQLLTFSDEKTRRRAESLLARQVTDPNRQEVLARFQAALAGSRDTQHGQALFQEHCVKCHSVQGQGGQIGPDLGGAKGRAEETLLLDILQPSDTITAGYHSYMVMTLRGDLFTGILSAETATSVTLPSDDGTEQAILRKDIESITASATSIMPENFEELLRPGDVADLLGYLREALGPGSPVLTLFDDDRSFAEALNEGAGAAAVSTEDRLSGRACLVITPPQRFSAQIAGWNHRILEHPGAGEYRYLQFAWKSPRGHGVMLELAADGQWPPAGQALRRYYCGHNTTGWQARQLSPHVPKDWTVVTVDLWKDFGVFTLTGLAPTAMGGAAFFDGVRLLRTLDAASHGPAAQQ